MPSSLDDASRRWAQRSLKPTPLGVSKWETHAQDVNNGVASWGGRFNQGLRDVGASPSERFVRKYIERSAEAAGQRRYSAGVEDAVRDDRWKKGFLNGVNR